MLHLLSHKGRDVCGFHLEGTVVCPKVDGICDAGASALVDHFGRLWARDVELEVGIFLPVAEKQWELEKESVVGVAQSGQGLWTGITIQAALEALAGTHKLLPSFEAVWVGLLGKRESNGQHLSERVYAFRTMNDPQHTTSALSFLISTLSSSEPP